MTLLISRHTVQYHWTYIKKQLKACIIAGHWLVGVIIFILRINKKKKDIDDESKNGSILQNQIGLYFQMLGRGEILV